MGLGVFTLYNLSICDFISTASFVTSGLNKAVILLINEFTKVSDDFAYKYAFSYSGYGIAVLLKEYLL